jgi:hypothetical protein
MKANSLHTSCHIGLTVCSLITIWYAQVPMHIFLHTLPAWKWQLYLQVRGCIELVV